MKSLRPILLAACLAALLAAAAGCGGGDDESSSSTTSSTTSTTTSTGSSQTARLSQADWERYLEEKAKAQQVNQAAIKTFNKCSKIIETGANQDAVQACFGDSTKKVVTEGQKLLAFIADISEGVSGECAAATGMLHNAVMLYVSSVNALNLASDNNFVPTTQSVDTAQRALVAARAQTAAFETACKPAA